MKGRMVMEFPPLEAVLCDMAGTLVASEEYHLEAWNKLLELFGHQPPSPDWNDDCIGLPDSAARDKTLQFFPDMAEGGDILEIKQNIFREMVKAAGESLAYPGVRDRLLALRSAGVGLAVGTNSMLANTRATLGAAGLLGCFSVLVTADSVAEPKPAPDIYLKAARDLGVEPCRCLVLEDSLAGLEAAQAAGCVVAGIANTWPAEKLHPVDVTFATTAEALDWAKDHISRAASRE